MDRRREDFDVVVVGAGAAGMMCALEAGKRRRRVLVLDHGKTPGEKIRISGGGRCNFTNLHTAPDRFLSANPRFCASALSRFQPADILAMFERSHILWREKAAGQLFCDGSAIQVVRMLTREMANAGVVLRLGQRVGAIDKTAEGFAIAVDGGDVSCRSLVIATGGKSIPKMGATGFGYEVAAHFSVNVVATRPGLTPFTLEGSPLARAVRLAGVSLHARVSCDQGAFEDAVLFTHRGLSGPAILQISSYWRSGEEVKLDLAPNIDVFQTLRKARAQTPRQSLASGLAHFLPRRLAQQIALDEEGPIGEASDATLRRWANAVGDWRVTPSGTEGYRTAEVTVGGVDTRALDQRTMEVRTLPGLYFVGEVVDVTGWLGGYNFQWAWASGWCAGQVV